jgi:two-component system, OmpR family, sensor histidine kinase BaeS
MPERWSRHGPPPWWPDEEGWPPSSAVGPWRSWRRRAIWLAIAGFGALILVWSVAGYFFFGGGGRPGRGFFPWFIIPITLLILFVVARGVRRTWAPMGSLIDATSRLADGDYRARVEPAGPPQLREVMSAFNRMASRIEAADEQRRRLLADVSHELRTPLTVIQGSVEAMLDGVHPADDDHLTRLLEETRVLSRLLDDLRTVTLAEAGRLSLHLERTDIGALVEDAVASLLSQAEDAGVSVTVDAESDLPEIELDPVRIREVVVNLVINALRHTPQEGSIIVDVATDPAGALVSVRDDGTGIQPDALPHVFDRFVKSADSTGTGLGLTIARDLVEAHGGSITAISSPEEGTTVSFTIPGRPR